MNRLKEKYEKEIKKTLQDELKIANVMAVPKVTKVVVNIGMGDMGKAKELAEQMKTDLKTITGQAPSVRLARNSIASFSIRRGMPVGLKVTLRGTRMYAFLDKLFSIVLPRLRDFRGIPTTGFDKNGNYSLGLIEHTVYPEIDIVKSKPVGLEITIVTTAKDSASSRRLLELLGTPFEKES